MIGIGFRHSLQVQFSGDQVLVGEVTPEFLGPVGDIRRLALGLFSIGAGINRAPTMGLLSMYTPAAEQGATMGVAQWYTNRPGLMAFAVNMVSLPGSVWVMTAPPPGPVTAWKSTE